MPLIPASDFQAPLYLSNNHAQTLLANVVRKVPGVKYLREKIPTPDRDFLLLDWSRQGHERLVILSHGLEGHSRRPYMLGMVKRLNQQGFDALAWNFRSCGGELNEKLSFYHGGLTEDLDCVIRHVEGTRKYREIFLVGFSLGGNLTLKWLGENEAKAEHRIRRAATVSVPVDLADSVKKMSENFNKAVYTNYFLSEFRQKMKLKAARMPDAIDLSGLHSIRDLREWDEKYTAPTHGFRSAEDFYAQTSSVHYLQGIRIPTLLINATDDPFLGPGCYPVSIAKEHAHLYLEMPEKGGHVGFFKGPLEGYWTEKRVAEWLKGD